jgi:hypothetical protein
VETSGLGHWGDGSVEDGGEEGVVARGQNGVVLRSSTKDVSLGDFGGVAMPWLRDGDRFRFLLVVGSTS